ncbi:MAG: TIGR04076 family protein [Candidatus Helarchaeota archaeon]|nr:TIGR04076 family protein [Candidatus Helarchaeota archaeon]
MNLAQENRLEIMVKKIHGTCPVHSLGDKIVIEGPSIKMDETDAICLHAFSCISTFLVALRDGIDPKVLGLAKTSGDTAYYQCLDPGEPYTSGGTVVFEIKVKLKDRR